MKPTRIFDLLPYQERSFPQETALAYKYDGEWKPFSTLDCLAKINSLSTGLLKQGLQPDDKVAIMSANRPEWIFADMAVLQLGAIDVPIYPTMIEKDILFILNHAECKFIFIENEEMAEKVLQIADEVPTLRGIYLFERNNHPRLHYWKELLIEPDDASLNEIAARSAKIDEHDLATIIYTSGTTGTPKGVMLSHHNLVKNVQCCMPLMPVDHTHRALSFLPISHSYERMLNYLYINTGLSIYYAESLETIAQNLQEVSPQIFGTVPRLLEKVYDKIMTKGAALGFPKKQLFFWALNLGHHYKLYGEGGWWYELKLKIANATVFKKWREALGGEIKAVVSGSAALQPRLSKIFNAAGIPVVQGYGLTESSPVISVNGFGPHEHKFGTVGRPIPEGEVKIAEDGEILYKGPNVMMGYYKSTEQTAEVIDEAGWLHTGDIGDLDDDGFLRITDRKKEVFKTSGGKYIAPQPIENKLKESPFIEQVMVIGEFRKFPGALIVPNFEYLRGWLKDKQMDVPASNEAIIALDAVKKRIRKEVNLANEHFSNYERIKQFALIPSEWTIDAGELTPTLKHKRKVILEKYSDKVEEIYKEAREALNADT